MVERVFGLMSSSDFLVDIALFSFRRSAKNRLVREISLSERDISALKVSAAGTVIEMQLSF